MNSRISIRTWTERFENPQGVAVVFDIFRCSTTIYSLHGRKLGPLFVAPSLRAVQEDTRLPDWRVFSELSQPSACIERFDNSPHHALTHEVHCPSTSLVATTTGTPAMFAAREFSKVYVGSLVSFSALIKTLAALDCAITLIPAALPDSSQIEDEIVAQAVATALEGFANIPDFVQQCAMQAKEKILSSPRPEVLAKKLVNTGVEDVRLALEIDRYSEVLALSFEGHGPFAKVETV
ncbi:MAG: 2-phosphosulfolactate phosphatase [Bdellovibrionota bacterium]